MPPKASTSFLTELVEAFIEDDSAFELFEEHRTTYRPDPATPLPANVGGRSTRRSRSLSSEALRDRESEDIWAQLWVVALYIGIDQLYDAPDLKTWVTEVEAPLLVVHALNQNYRSLKNLREQQIALILRIRKVWGADFYRRLRLLPEPILLTRLPAHGYLTQLAKLAEAQYFDRFRTSFPHWLVKYIPTTKTHISGLAAHQKGERVVGKGDLSDYLIYITTKDDRRLEAIDSCPQVGHIHRQSKRRRISRADPSTAGSPRSPSPVEQPRRAPLDPIEELTEDLIEEDLTLDKNTPAPYTLVDHSRLEETEHQLDEELGVSQVEFDVEECDPNDSMAHQPSKFPSPRSERSTSESDDPLSDEALQNASAVTLQERVRRRAVALRALAEATTQMNAADKRKSEVESDILHLLGIQGHCDDVTSLLRENMTHVDGKLAALQSMQAIADRNRADLKNIPGVNDDPDLLGIWGFDRYLEQDPPGHSERVKEFRATSAAMGKQWELLKEAVFVQHTADVKLVSAKKAVIMVDKEYKEYTQTVMALFETNNPELLHQASKLL